MTPALATQNSDPHVELVAQTRAAQAAARAYVEAAKTRVAARLEKAGGGGEALRQEQRAVHALAWAATYAETLAQMSAWAAARLEEGAFGPVEAALTRVLFGEYLAHLAGGVPLGQGEVARPWDMDAASHAAELSSQRDVARLIVDGTSPAARAALAAALPGLRGAASVGDPGLDETLRLVSDQFRRFAADQVAPHAHGWHMADDLIPMAIIDAMSELGVFGLTIPEEHGGLGMDKTAMCVVSEELSRGYIGVGSLGTRSEIAAELILRGGTEAQKATYLPQIASGAILPTAVFTEPNVGSDLGSLQTRATRDGDDWVITGQKTWITHAARADLMTVLARTNPEESGWRGLSMFLCEKPRGTDADPFPAEGLSGGEIEVLGYRGMKEYTLSFDGFRVPGDALLGGVEGLGFKHLMSTFESARIQTAARAVGVAQNAFDLGLAYALDREQFGRPLIEFPRVSDKLAIAAAEIMGARQLTYFAARTADRGERSDLEAGMAKLLAARIAWTAADAALQIHGGNGFALEYEISRVLCDARILNIFEGAAEIQAQVISRRLFEAT